MQELGRRSAGIGLMLAMLCSVPARGTFVIRSGPSLSAMRNQLLGGIGVLNGQIQDRLEQIRGTYQPMRDGANRAAEGLRSRIEAAQGNPLNPDYWNLSELQRSLQLEQQRAQLAQRNIDRLNAEITDLVAQRATLQSSLDSVNANLASVCCPGCCNSGGSKYSYDNSAGLGLALGAAALGAAAGAAAAAAGGSKDKDDSAAKATPVPLPSLPPPLSAQLATLPNQASSSSDPDLFRALVAVSTSPAPPAGSASVSGSPVLGSSAGLSAGAMATLGLAGAAGARGAALGTLATVSSPGPRIAVRGVTESAISVDNGAAPEEEEGNTKSPVGKRRKLRRRLLRGLKTEGKRPRAKVGP